MFLNNSQQLSVPIVIQYFSIYVKQWNVIETGNLFILKFMIDFFYLNANENHTNFVSQNTQTGPRSSVQL